VDESPEGGSEGTDGSGPERSDEPPRGRAVRRPGTDDHWGVDAAIGAASVAARTAGEVAEAIGGSGPGRVMGTAARWITRPLAREGEDVRARIEDEAAPAAQQVLRQVTPGVVRAVDINAILAEIDVDLLLDRIDVNRVVDRIDVGSIVAKVDVNELIAGVDVQALIDRVDIDGIVQRVDVAGLVGRIDLNELISSVDLDGLLASVDLQALLDRIDLDALLASVDLQALLDRIDLDALLASVDLQALLDRIDLDALLARVTWTRCWQRSTSTPWCSGSTPPRSSPTPSWAASWHGPPAAWPPRRSTRCGARGSGWTASSCGS